MKPEDLRELIRLVEESEIDELEIRRWGRTVRIVKNGSRGGAVLALGTAGANAPPSSVAGPSEGTAPAPAPAEASTAYHAVTSPMVGTFYRAPSPEAPPFVEVGDTVRLGQTLCILEAMKLMNELQAEVSGVVRKVLVENGAPVEYGQVLFEIELT